MAAQCSLYKFITYPFWFFFFCGLPSSQAMSPIGAIAASLYHSNVGSKLHLQPTATPDANPLSKARDQTHILVDSSQIHFHCATMGTPLTDGPLCSSLIAITNNDKHPYIIHSWGTGEVFLYIEVEFTESCIFPILIGTAK